MLDQLDLLCVGVMHAEWAWSNEVRATADSSERDGREDIELGLIELKIATLQRIDEALSRLHHGTYGYCGGCRSRISESRLSALPFAVRCRSAKRRANGLNDRCEAVRHGND